MRWRRRRKRRAMWIPCWMRSWWVSIWTEIYTICPRSSDPFYKESLLYKMGHYFLDILYYAKYYGGSGCIFLGYNFIFVRPGKNDSKVGGWGWSKCTIFTPVLELSMSNIFTPVLELSILNCYSFLDMSIWLCNYFSIQCVCLIFFLYGPIVLTRKCQIYNGFTCLKIE